MNEICLIRKYRWKLSSIVNILCTWQTLIEFWVAPTHNIMAQKLLAYKHDPSERYIILELVGISIWNMKPLQIQIRDFKNTSSYILHIILASHFIVPEKIHPHEIDSNMQYYSIKQTLLRTNIRFKANHRESSQNVM